LYPGLTKIHFYDHVSRFRIQLDQKPFCFLNSYSQRRDRKLVYIIFAVHWNSAEFFKIAQTSPLHHEVL